MTYGGLTLNDPTTADDYYEVNRIRPRILTNFVSDTRQDRDGTEVQIARKSALVVDVDIRIVAPTHAKLMDKCRTLAETFDPALVSRDNPTVRGFLAFDGSAQTTDTDTYASGLIPKRIYARAMNPVVPEVGDRESETHVGFVTIPLLCRDPRVYLQSEVSDVLGTTSEVVSNATADYPSYPTLTIVATAAAGEFAIDKTGDGLDALTLDLELLGAGTYVIDMAAQTILFGGISRPEVYVSGSWFDLAAGNSTVTINDLTGITSATLTWRPALAF